MIGFIAAPMEDCASNGFLARGLIPPEAAPRLAPPSGRISPGRPGTRR